MALIELTLENPAFKRTELPGTETTEPTETIEEPDTTGGSSRAGAIVSALVLVLVVGLVARSIRNRRS
ncbi:MAG: hypothetical protein U5K37_11190 [Natrialbaceae archaeon]|nr:hypothetical protein [Natrialbaceae archaeon]